MVNKEIVDYIGKHVRKGHHPDKIKEKLFKAGHKKEHVEEAIAHHYHRKHSLDIFALSLLIVVLFVFVILYNVDLIGEEIVPEVSEKKVMEDAIAALDKSKCDEMISQELKETCLNSISKVEVIIQSAIDSIDETKCLELENQDLKNNCINAVFIVEESQTKEEIVSEKASSVSDMGYFSESLEKKDISICEGYEDEEKIINCKDNYYFSMSVEEGEEMCNLISNEDVRNSCIIIKNEKV